MRTPYDIIVILGPTASGKTSVAAHLANEINGEIISGDSRQFYRGMSIGTGKDLDDYTINGKIIPYHLIDIVDAGYKYNIYEYARDFNEVFNKINERNSNAILCGGSGLYIEAILKKYTLMEVPVNENLRNELSEKSHEELVGILSNLRPLHNSTDIVTDKRLIRAIEIELFQKNNSQNTTITPTLSPIIFGIKFDRATERARIKQRLLARLEQGMISEVETLLASGIAPDDLVYYGLEYKFLTWHLTGKMSYHEMVEKLEIAICQFAKRQMTWFRGMEKRGISINWIAGEIPLEEKLHIILKKIDSKN